MKQEPTTKSEANLSSEQEAELNSNVHTFIFDILNLVAKSEQELVIQVSEMWIKKGKCIVLIFRTHLIN